MKLVSAVFVACAAIAIAVPASAQPARTLNQNNFAVFIDGVEQKFVRTVEFEGVQSVQANNDRAGGKVGPGTFQIKLNVSRAGEQTFDEWLLDGKAPVRMVRVELRAPQGKPEAAHEFQNCAIAKSEWKLDASAPAIATSTWTLTCSSMTRGKL